MKRFTSRQGKINIIKGVFRKGEKLEVKEICERIYYCGYNVIPKSIGMFIHYNMVHKYLKKEEVKNRNKYSLI